MERKSRRRCKSSVGASVWEVHGLPSAADASGCATPAAAQRNARGETMKLPFSRIRSGSDSRPPHTYSHHESVFSVVSFYFTVPVAAEVTRFHFRL